MPRGRIEKVNLIALFKISNHKPVGFLDDFLEAETNCSTEELRDKIAVGPYSVVIVDVLHCAVRRPRLYKGLGDNFLSAVELGSGKWADIAVLEPVRDYKARHASTLLTFDAVVSALDQIEAKSDSKRAQAAE